MTMFTKIRTLTLMISAVLVAGFLSLYVYESAQAEPVQKSKVAITQIVDHPSLNKIRKGILDELAANGFKEGKSLEVLYQNPQGNMATAAQIAKSFVSSKPDVIVAITTPSAQAVLNATKKTEIPIVYGAVTDPVGAKLIPNYKKPSSQVTGTIDLPPVSKQIEQIKRLFPKTKKLGVIYNPGEANNTFQVAAIKKEAKAQGLEVVESTASKSADITTATQHLMEKVEAILLPNDNTVISALESILRVTNAERIPVFTSDPDSIKRGAVGAVANDQYLVGRETGKLVVQILKGKTPAQLLSQFVKVSKEYLNAKVLEALKEE